MDQQDYVDEEAKTGFFLKVIKIVLHHFQLIGKVREEYNYQGPAVIIMDN